MNLFSYANNNPILDSNNQVVTETVHPAITVTLNVKNAGKVLGEEVVQLYLRDKVGSVVRPIIELKDFQKIQLNAGETKNIQFIIDKEKLSFYNAALQWITEPGDFEVMMGSSSSDIRLRTSFELIN